MSPIRSGALVLAFLLAGPQSDDPFVKTRETRLIRYLKGAGARREAQLRVIGIRVGILEDKIKKLEDSPPGNRGPRRRDEGRHARRRPDSRELRKWRQSIDAEKEKLEELVQQAKKTLDRSLYHPDFTPYLDLRKPLNIGDIGVFRYRGGCELEVDRVVGPDAAIVRLWCSSNGNHMRLWLKNVNTKDWVDDRQIEPLADIFDVVGKARPPLPWGIPDLVFVLEACERPTPPKEDDEQDD
jgi:hypothetical protein